MKQVTFIRWGGVNFVKQKKNKYAPEKQGIWCFPLGVVDLFFVPTDKQKHPPRKFKFSGYVWIHPEQVPNFIKILPYEHKMTKSGLEWILVDTNQLHKIVNILKTTNNRPARYNKVHQAKIIRFHKYYQKCGLCGRVRNIKQKFTCECDFNQWYTFECFIPRQRKYYVP